MGNDTVTFLICKSDQPFPLLLGRMWHSSRVRGFNRDSPFQSLPKSPEATCASTGLNDEMLKVVVLAYQWSQHVAAGNLVAFPTSWSVAGISTDLLGCGITSVSNDGSITNGTQS